MSNNSSYDHKRNEKKWRKIWEDKGMYKTPEDATKDDKYYILPQLPYPSGAGLHVGHAEVYSACDIMARFKRMKGEKVLQVMGWDSFGLPAENFAIKTNVHPKINTDKAVDNFRDQIKQMGVSVDWDREVGSHNSDYYKWTQWFFLLMYNQGLAYRKNQKVNWCPSCKTVLANEQVEVKGGKNICERCDTEIEYKMMEQWYLKITDYADRLAADLDKVDWPKETVKRQRDWIGRSEGIEIAYDVKGSDLKIICFTTTPVNWGASFIVVAPDYVNVQGLITKEYKEEVEKYIKEATSKTDLERVQDGKNKTGVFTGSYAINHVTGEEIPIWIADFVVASVGTGAVQGCPGHDMRDFEFAQKYDISIPRVVVGPEGDMSEIDSPEKVIEKGMPGKMVNSEFLDGVDFKEAMSKTMDYFEEKGWGKRVVTYKLRDWSVSRQRFWGAPIPMLHREVDDNEVKDVAEQYQENPDRFVNVHAVMSNSKEHYHPWIDEKLDAFEVESINPDLPQPNTPNIEEWVEAFEQVVKDKDLKNTVVSGRSLGGWAAMKFAESHKIRKLILVAPTVPIKEMFDSWDENFSDASTIKSVKEFVGGADGNADLEAIRDNVGEIVVFLSTDDPYIPLEETEAYFKKHFPFVRIRRFRESRHFDESVGYDSFPALLEEILTPVRLDLKPVHFDDLPVLLPDDVDFKPTGESPLNYSEKFHEGVEEKYGQGFKREPDTLDTFMCSSWYYYRYLDPKNDQEFASSEALKKWMPVDFYLGGPEHVNGHLLYSRFFTKVLYDAGYIDFDEPFLVHRHQGLILGEDNKKMSKRWGNVINPSDVAEEHGADTLRMYEMFMGPLTDDKPWNTQGVVGVKRFVEKVWRLREKIEGNSAKQQEVEINKLIKKIETDVEELSFNTAIAKMMEFVNFVQKDEAVSQSVWEKFLRVLAPFAPFITEELWQLLGNKESIHEQTWPEYDETQLASKNATIIIQVNGKLRDTIEASVDSSKKEVESLAKKRENVKKFIDGKEIANVVFVENKLVNFVIK